MDKVKQLKAELEKMYAVELLEYHDKNHLSGDNCIRSERRQEMLQYSIKLLSELPNKKHDKLEMQLAFEAGQERNDFDEWYKEAERKWF